MNSSSPVVRKPPADPKREAFGWPRGRPRRGFSRFVLSLLLLSTLIVACSFAASSGDSAGRGILGGTNTDHHSVDLADIHFDTFDGLSIPLSTIAEETMLSLRDRIPPLDDVRYETAGEGAWLDAGDLVLGYAAKDGASYAYPARILNFHEIVNQELGGEPVLISYCPLCRSGVVYSRRVDDRVLSFGNTSALYQSDLVMYDRETLSYWFQVAGEAIVGDLTGSRLEALPSVMTTWAEWLMLHPDTLVLSRDTGFSRTYGGDAFQGIEAFLDRGDFVFPVDEDMVDDRLAASELVLGVEVAGEARAYPLASLKDGAFNDVVGGTPIAVFSRELGPLALAFDARLGDRVLTFRWDGRQIVDGETGSAWSLQGEAVQGQLAGQHLQQLPARTAFWFSYVTAFPTATVYDP